MIRLLKGAIAICSVGGVLGACEEVSEEDYEKVLKEEVFKVENVDFNLEEVGAWELGDDEYKILIDTDQETLVADLEHTTFKKTDDNSSVHAKWIEKKGEIVESYEYMECVIEINKDDVSAISKKYAKEFNETMKFVE